MQNSKNQQNFYSQNEETPNQDSNFDSLKKFRSENNESKPKKTSQKDDEFFYYETENYKNYKYKLYNIDLAQIERKKLTGQKIYVSDYNYPLDELDERTKKKFFGLNNHFERKGRSEQKLLPSTSVHDMKKLNILNKINKISMDLRIEGTRKTEKPAAVGNNSQNDSLQNMLPKLEKTKNQFKKQDDLQLLNGRLMGIINHKRLNLPLLNTTNKNSNNSVHNNNNNEADKSLYRKKIGGGFTLIVKKHALKKLDKNQSVSIDKNILQQNNKNISINEQINQIIKSKKIKKTKSVGELKFKQKPNRTIYEEFIFLARSTQETIKIGNFIFFF